MANCLIKTILIIFPIPKTKKKIYRELKILLIKQKEGSDSRKNCSLILNFLTIKYNKNYIKQISGVNFKSKIKKYTVKICKGAIHQILYMFTRNYENLVSSIMFKDFKY